jgi:hypothetical protein
MLNFFFYNEEIWIKWWVIYKKDLKKWFLFSLFTDCLFRGHIRLHLSTSGIIRSRSIAACLLLACYMYRNKTMIYWFLWLISELYKNSNMKFEKRHVEVENCHFKYQIDKKNWNMKSEKRHVEVENCHFKYCRKTWNFWLFIHVEFLLFV